MAPDQNTSTSRIGCLAALALLFFFALEAVAVLAGVWLAVSVVQLLTGHAGTPSFGLFMIAFLPGLVIGYFIALPIDRLCRRLTGASAFDAFGSIGPFI